MGIRIAVKGNHYLLCSLRVINALLTQTTSKYVQVNEAETC